jgi:predicted TIM-barrel fold metal-dependent hydrolase
LWENARPSNVEQIFADPAFGRPTVVLLHGGVPDSWLAGWYASAYANVYVDFSWLGFLSGVTLERCLDEWLDYVPSNKLVFGTDSWSPELFVAGSREARAALARVLERRVATRRYTASVAEQVAVRLMRTNAQGVYGLVG